MYKKRNSSRGQKPRIMLATDNQERKYFRFTKKFVEIAEISRAKYVKFYVDDEFKSIGFKFLERHEKEKGTNRLSNIQGIKSVCANKLLKSFEWAKDLHKRPYIERIWFPYRFDEEEKDIWVIEVNNPEF